MKIAIAIDNKNKDSEISSRGGRAPYYLIFDGEGKLLETIDNPFSVGGGGAGYGVAKMLADKDVNIIVAGEFEPKIIDAMEERGLKHKVLNGKIDDAIKNISVF